MAPRTRSGGLILCGGRSSRMGYDKLQLRFPGGSLLERVLGQMRTVAHPIVLSLAPGQATTALPPGVHTVKDSVANQGPLWGLLEGFRKLAGQCDQVVVMPVDLPFLTGPWIERLLEHLEGRAACVYQQDGIINALTAAYSMRLLPKLEALVEAGRRRPLFLVEGEDTHIVTLPPASSEGPVHPLMDVDTPEAYRGALLHEGIGRAGAPEVTVTLHTPASEGNVLPAGYLALYAASAADAVQWARLLYPELPLHDSAAVRVLRGEHGAQETELRPQDPLWRGEHLRIQVQTATP